MREGRENERQGKTLEYHAPRNDNRSCGTSTFSLLHPASSLPSSILLDSFFLLKQFNQSTMSNPTDSHQLFKPIGEIATETNDLADVPDDDKRLDEDHPQFEQEEEDGVREVQQIESLCMECHEQVRYSYRSFGRFGRWDLLRGN